MNSSCCNYGQYPMDAAYRTSFTFDYNGDTLAVDFAANCLQDIAEESRGLDNIKAIVGEPFQPPSIIYMPIIRAVTNVYYPELGASIRIFVIAT